MNTIENNTKQIDIIKISKLLWSNKKKYLYTIPIALVIGCIYIFSLPRYYECEVSLAPELNNTSSLSGSLGSIASSLGMGSLASKGLTSDAISPELYPDLIKSTNFRVSMFPVKIRTNDGSVKTNYYDYLISKQKVAWWNIIFGGIKKIFIKNNIRRSKGTDKVNPFRLNKDQYDIANAIGSKIKCNVDKKTDVISIFVEDQDQLVAATIADSVQERLQRFITDYRTKKARNDLEYTKKLFYSAKKQYEISRQRYAAYGDANQDVVLPSYQLKQEDLENEMQLRYNVYTTIMAQLQSAQAKVLERTPAFTTLESATVPFKPAGPKRMVFMIGIFFFSFVLTSIYILVLDARKKQVE